MAEHWTEPFIDDWSCWKCWKYVVFRLPSVALTPDEYKVKRGFKLPPMASPPSTNSSGSTSKRGSRFSRSDPSSLNTRDKYGYYRPTKPLHLEPLEADQSFDREKHKRKTQKMFEQRLRWSPNNLFIEVRPTDLFFNPRNHGFMGYWEYYILVNPYLKSEVNKKFVNLNTATYSIIVYLLLVLARTFCCYDSITEGQNFKLWNIANNVGEKGTNDMWHYKKL